VPGIVHFMGPYLYRSSFHATTDAHANAWPEYVRPPG
jgi:hypothetical protein